jgi:hypothetical protein
MMQNNVIDHPWGKETYFAGNELYVGKFLQFDNAGSKIPMQFHKEKDKTLTIMNGTFSLKVIDVSTGKIEEKILRQGESWRILTLVPHELEALENNSVIIEVGTSEVAQDTYIISDK